MGTLLNFLKSKKKELEMIKTNNEILDEINLNDYKIVIENNDSLNEDDYILKEAINYVDINHKDKIIDAIRYVGIVIMGYKYISKEIDENGKTVITFRDTCNNDKIINETIVNKR